MGSFAVSVHRARGVWDALTGGPDTQRAFGSLGCTCVKPGSVVAVPDAGTPAAFAHLPGCDLRGGVYSPEAAGAIVALAVALWADTARGLVEDGGEEDA